MNSGKSFSDFRLERVELGPKWASAEITFQSAGKDAAWELCIEMLTRIVTQLRTVSVGIASEP